MTCYMCIKDQSAHRSLEVIKIPAFSCTTDLYLAIAKLRSPSFISRRYPLKGFVYLGQEEIYFGSTMCCRVTVR